MNDHRYLERPRSESQLLHRRLLSTSIQRRFYSTITTVTVQTDLTVKPAHPPGKRLRCLTWSQKIIGGHTLAAESFEWRQALVFPFYGFLYA